MSLSKTYVPKKIVRCAIYTRVSTDQGLDQEFNSLDAQREASEAYIKSQAHEGWVCLKDQYDDGGFSGGSIERPALQKLLVDVRQQKLDVIVVYKVDRLTRSLADFAKLVELFDAHEVSFVSVTQSFNTTSSMGRLTLNVLLSFAQFEREVTGERIRDKIAASKKKGLWMGGVVPHGYRVDDRKLVIDPSDAEEIRLIFDLYCQLKSIPALVRELDQRGIRSRVRGRSSGKEMGGITFMAGPLSHILGNCVYVGKINHREKSYPGEHEPIITQEQFDRVQEIRRSQMTRRSEKHQQSGALLAGLIYDDCGHHMSPTHVKKGSIRYGYYQSSVLAHGLKHKAGSVCRVPAAEIEKVVTAAVHQQCERRGKALAADNTAIREIVRKVEVLPALIKLTFKPAEDAEAEVDSTTVTIPWSKPSSVRKREILGDQPQADLRPIRTEARTRLLKGIAQGRRWLELLLDGKVSDVPTLAKKHEVSEKTVRSTLSLAFLAPDIIQGAIDGKLPRGLGVSQLTDLSVNWTEQRRQLGIG